MRKNVIKDSNDLLGFLIANKDQNNDCDLYTVLDVIGDNKSLDLQHLINELVANNLIAQTDTCTVHIFEQGFNVYLSPQKKLWNIVKRPLSYVFTYILGILSTVIAQLIIDAIMTNTKP